MAKFSDKRSRYFAKTKPYREIIDQLLKQENVFRDQIWQGGSGAHEKRIILVENMVKCASGYIILSEISQSMMEIKNEEALNEGRKSLYKSIVYLEDLVGFYVDAAFSEYEKRLADLDFLNPAQRYLLVRKIGLTIQLLECAYGDTTKWRWAFVDLEGRYAAVAKNIFDLKAAVLNTDPRSPWYEPTVSHLRLIRRLLRRAADRYRQKYELSSGHIDDFSRSIEYLQSLRRIHILMNEREEAEQIKKQLDIWSNKLETDIKRKQEIPPLNT
ncbi:MAG: hypothetical protein LBG76_04450 [Treponema sp.]|jgi:hypothetical protein|nr:hypothetical protein [Treponema sp.]